MRVPIVVAAILLPIGQGCASAVEVARDSAADRAARELSCPREGVVVKPRPDLSDRTFDVDACGHSARYTCPVRESGYPSSARVACTRESADGPGVVGDSGTP